MMNRLSFNRFAATAALLALLCIPAALAQTQVSRYGSGNAGIKVLFIGNSFTYGVPEIFAALAESEGKKAKIYTAAYPSYTLEEHLKTSSTMSALSREGPWDFVVLQERSHYPVTDPEKMEKACAEFDRKIKSAGAKTVLMMTWADDGDTTYQPVISGAYRKIGSQLNATVVPVGDTFFRVRQSDPSIELYGSDKHHANHSGSFLAACMLYTKLVGDARRVPSGFERQFDVPETAAEKLRAFAADNGTYRNAAVSPARSATRTSAATGTAGGAKGSNVPMRSPGNSRSTVQTYKW
jgi:hypothetical protein